MNTWIIILTKLTHTSPETVMGNNPNPSSISPPVRIVPWAALCANQPQERDHQTLNLPEHGFLPRSRQLPECFWYCCRKTGPRGGAENGKLDRDKWYKQRSEYAPFWHVYSSLFSQLSCKTTRFHAAHQNLSKDPSTSCFAHDIR